MTQLETWDGDSFRSFVITENFLHDPGFVLFQFNWQITLSKSMKNGVGTLMGIALNL